MNSPGKGCHWVFQPMFHHLIRQFLNRAKPYYPIRIKKQAVQIVAAGLLSEDEACQRF